jgi:outer membrane beta-barrel protein
MRRFVPGLAALLALAAATVAIEPTAEAQEIQLTGPLAGAPAVKKLRLYREGRFTVAPSFGFTLLDEYSKTFLAGGQVQYNIFDWLGVGVYGAGAIFSSTNLTDQTAAIAPRNTFTAGNVGPDCPAGTNPAGCRTPGGTQTFTNQVGRMTFMIVPQAQAIPFRGKLSLFEKLFVDTDFYLHAGVAIVGLEERAECGTTGKPACTDPSTFSRSGRIAPAPSFGLGLNFFFNDLIALGVEYRAFPFSWNRGGYDSKGGPPDGNFPDQKVSGPDGGFYFNQMISFNLGFTFGTRKLSE